MSQQTDVSQSITKFPEWPKLVLSAVLFSILYTQAPLYYSNQNQYFLHGFEMAGQGSLSNDWLAKTLDPTPIFSGMVANILQYFHECFFHLALGIILGAYVLCSWLIFKKHMGSREKLAQSWWIYFGFLAVAHAAILRWLSFRILGNDYPWFFQAGVAGQYILGGMLQPSTFGVFLLLGIALYYSEKPWLGTFFVCLGGILHSTYLLAGAMIILGFQVDLLLRGCWKKAIYLGLFALALVMPSVIYVGSHFQPTDKQAFESAQEFLVQFRLPHHCLPKLWLDWVACLQISWIIFCCYLCRKNSLGIIMFTCVILSSALTLTQYFTNSNSLALLFPWRISSILVPLATLILISKISASEKITGRFYQWNIVSFGIVMVLAGFGICIMYLGWGYRVNNSENRLLAFIKANQQKSDQYLIPIQIPNLAKTTKGSLSSDFKPAVTKKADTRVVPIDMQRFRLVTLAPLYIDFKSIPYQDADVLEWHRRLLNCESWYNLINNNKVDEVLPFLKKEKITHLVTTSKNPELPNPFKLLFKDENYLLWEIQNK